MTNFYSNNYKGNNGGLFKQLTCIALFCTLFGLSGCNGFEIPGFGDKKIKTEKTANKAEEIDSATMSEADMQDEISYVEDIRPKREYNPKNLFGKNIRSDSERMDRLERAVQDMRNEFDSVKPSITRLMSLEGDIQKLIKELKNLNEQDESKVIVATNKPMGSQFSKGSNTYVPPTPSNTAMATAPTSFQTKTAPSPSAGTNVYDVRVGEHPGRTRIVIDVNAKTPFTADIDNSENILVVDLPQAGWSAATSKNLGNSGFLSSYKVENSGNGNLIIFQLKKSARILSKEDLGGSGSSRRLVIDVGN